MAEPFLGEVKMMAFNFAPRGWALCDGQLLPIAQNQALFALLGAMYGGNATTNFALPNLRSRVPVHFGGGGIVQGQVGGEATHTLTLAETPAHTHTAKATAATAGTGDPTNAFWANAARNNFTTAAPNNLMNAATVAPVGSSLPHENMPPFLTLNFCIALQGIFPSQN